MERFVYARTEIATDEKDGRTCFECWKVIQPGQSYRHYINPEQGQDRVCICMTCEDEWPRLLRAEMRQRIDAAIEFGRLGERVLAIDRRLFGEWEGQNEMGMAERWRGLWKSQGRSALPAPPKKAAIAEEAAPLKASLARPSADWALDDVIAAFEKDATTVPPAFQDIQFYRSEAKKELCRRRREALPVIIDHLERTHSSASAKVLYFWGKLMSGFQDNMDPHNQAVPSMFNDTLGWIAWGRSMTKRRTASVS